MPNATKLPESFVAEVEAARQELAEVAVRALAVAGRYVAIRDRFNSEVVPREVRLVSDEPAETLWRESGAQQLADRLHELVERLAVAAELRVW